MLTPPAVFPKTYEAWSVDRKIRYLEHWHRMWEITHSDKLVVGTFSNEKDLTHEHEWNGATYINKVGELFVRCALCPAIKPMEEQ